MQSGFKKILVLVCLFNCFKAVAQEDSVMYARDSAVVTDCTMGFFARSEIPSKQKIKLITKAGKVVSMTSFFTSNEFSDNAEYGLADLDNDEKKELVISNY